MGISYDYNAIVNGECEWSESEESNGRVAVSQVVPGHRTAVRSSAACGEDILAGGPVAISGAASLLAVY